MFFNKIIGSNVHKLTSNPYFRRAIKTIPIRNLKINHTMEKLSDLDIEKRLIRFPEWDYFDNAIHAEFEFENFKDCFSAMSRIAFECEALNHHPNWSNVYNVLSVSLSTHDANGVTEKDFKLAEAIEFIVEPEDD